MKTIKHILFSILTLTVLTVSFIAYYSYQVVFVETLDKDTNFTIKPGEGFSKINYKLKKEGIIKDARLFHYYVKSQKELNSFKSGEFTLSKGSNYSKILKTLTTSPLSSIKITIPEGKNMFEIAKILERNNICKENEIISWMKNTSYLQELEVPGIRFEGYLYPDTYFFNENTHPKKVISTMVNNFKMKLKSLGLSLNDPETHKKIILASIVEKETGAKHERKIIAGVFSNRLRIRMRLQSDPTTIYGIYENFNGNLRKKHLLQKTPYNTYKIYGLPAGPIANPGLEAIKAVLAPAQHKYLYFVSYNNGTHKFSKTYKEHLVAVRQYQKNPKNRKGRSWRDLNKKKN